MKKIKVILPLLFILLLTGCGSKFEGTWCKYSDVATTLVILSNDISDDDMNKITEYIKTIKDLKSYDIIDKIEDASKMITIYYKSEDNIDGYEDKLREYNGITKIKSTKQNAVVDELIIKKDTYVYDKSLTSLDAYEYKGKYKVEDNVIELDEGIKFYYKDNFLCYDKDCNNLLIKTKKNSCNG